MGTTVYGAGNVSAAQETKTDQSTIESTLNIANYIGDEDTENLLYMELGAALGKPKEEVCETIINYINKSRQEA